MRTAEPREAFLADAEAARAEFLSLGDTDRSLQSGSRRAKKSFVPRQRGWPGRSGCRE